MNGRRFIDNYAFFLSKNFISWSSKRQDLIIQLSCELKYIIFNKVDKKTIWLQQLLHQLKIILKKIFIVIWADNQEIIAFAENLKFYYRIKHINIKYYWIYEAIADDKISLKYFFYQRDNCERINQAFNY